MAIHSDPSDGGPVAGSSIFPLELPTTPFPSPAAVNVWATAALVAAAANPALHFQ